VFSQVHGPGVRHCDGDLPGLPRHRPRARCTADGRRVANAAVPACDRVFPATSANEIIERFSPLLASLREPLGVDIALLCRREQVLSLLNSAASRAGASVDERIAAVVDGLLDLFNLDTGIVARMDHPPSAETLSGLDELARVGARGDGDDTVRDRRGAARPADFRRRQPLRPSHDVHSQLDVRAARTPPS
jgi:hypothetical protein